MLTLVFHPNILAVVALAVFIALYHIASQPKVH